MKNISIDLNFIKNQHEYLDVIKKEKPIVPLEEGQWLVSKYDDISFLLKDNRLSRQIEDPTEITVQSLLDLDGQDHLRLKRALMPYFIHSSIKSIEDSVNYRIKKTLNQIKQNEEKEIDIIKNFCFPIPLFTICDLLGVILPDDEDYDHVREKTLDIISVFNLTLDKYAYQRHLKSLEELSIYFINIIFSKKYKRKEGLLNFLENQYIDERKISKDEIIVMVLLLFVAGFETNTNSISNSIFSIIQNRKLIDQLDLKNDIIGDELIRHSTAINFVTRRVVSDFNFKDIKFKKNDIVFLHLGSANRDEDIFADPHNLNFSRSNAKKHLAFSSGPHYCVGASLSHMQVKNSVVHFFKEFPNVQITQTPIKNNNFAINSFIEIYASCS